MKVLIYEQRTGRIFRAENSGDPVKLGTGYAGHPPYVNDPQAQAMVARGPIPRGRYRVHKPIRHNRLGPVVIFLEPFIENAMHGRSGFFIHGDNAFMDQSASHGCIILNPTVRKAIAAFGAQVLEVVEG